MSGILDRLGGWLAALLSRPSAGYQPFTRSDPETLEAHLRPGDVLLVEGNQHISQAIKYLTQSTWSHSALYVGDRLKRYGEGNATLIEVSVEEGCVAVPLAKYRDFNTRICRPVGISDADRDATVEFMVASLGLTYDLKNVFDLIRYFLPTPPVPVRWRRRLIAFGSGDPTRAICSSLIAEAFGRVGYPILPALVPHDPHVERAVSPYSRREIAHIRNYALFAPRDFDLSPFFSVIKPTVEEGFDYRTTAWGKLPAAGKGG